MTETTRPAFCNKTLKRQFASYKWARNNTLHIFKAAQQAGIMEFTPHPDQYSILYQFQCLVTTDDAYYRKLTKASDTRFGVLVASNGLDIRKADIAESDIRKLLTDGLARLEQLLISFDEAQFERHAQSIQSIFNHEYLHQGQLVVLFRQAEIELPERFREAFAL